MIKLQDSPWFQQGLAGLEKEDSYSALMGFDGAIVREIQIGQMKNALILLEKSVTLLLQKNWFHETRSLIESFSRTIKRYGETEFATEGLISLGFAIIDISFDNAMHILKQVTNLDRKNEKHLHLQIGERLAVISQEKRSSDKRIMVEAGKNLVLAREYARGNELFENFLKDPLPTLFPMVLAYLALGHLIEDDNKSATEILNTHRKNKELQTVIRENEVARAYFDFNIEVFSSLRASDGIRYNSAKKAFLRVVGTSDPIMMLYIKELQTKFPSVPSPFF